MYTLCPMCHERVESVEFMDHMVNDHPMFFLVWASFADPGFHTPEHLLADTSYEYLSELCDTIGYHRVGVGDIEEHTTITVGTSDATCPICFDCIEVGRKINLCGHVFCDTCVQKWFADHKTCPVCVRDITEDDQMLDKSNPSSSMGPSSSMNTT